MWLYRSPIGNIYIKPLPNGRFGMVYNQTIWETCDTAQAEADNVYLQSTGCSEWDMLDVSNISVPIDLSEWEYI